MRFLLTGSEKAKEKFYSLLNHCFKEKMGSLNKISLFGRRERELVTVIDIGGDIIRIMDDEMKMMMPAKFYAGNIQAVVFAEATEARIAATKRYYGSSIVYAHFNMNSEDQFLQSIVRQVKGEECCHKGRNVM